MALYPVTEPSRLERLLFDASLVIKVPLANFYDVKARTSSQRLWQEPEEYALSLDAQNPAHWGHKLHAHVRGEFFVHALSGCQRVLDVGCGEGWPSLYLARYLPEVVGLDLSPEHVTLATNTAGFMGLDNVCFATAHIGELPFPDQTFDGVCFGGNVFTYSFNPITMLQEIGRVLRTGGPFAFEQWPIDPDRPAWERINFFIDGGPPILHYGAGSGLFSRSYFIYLKPESEPGRRLAALAYCWDTERSEDQRVADRARLFAGELSDEQQLACEQILQQLESGDLGDVERVEYAGEDRSLAANEFPNLLVQAGFQEIRSWALPDGTTFARSLQECGVLARLHAEDVRPCIRALVVSAQTSPGWDHQWVTCQKTT
ncbi:MAG: class I SAM-dependent methyltransferase [Chloroflexi bacterium]|nr:class I SAM-dependent methyltransferase [Chloroflexota bacterium]